MQIEFDAKKEHDRDLEWEGFSEWLDEREREQDEQDKYEAAQERGETAGL